MSLNKIIEHLKKMNIELQEQFNSLFVLKQNAALDALSRSKFSRTVSIVGLAGIMVAALLYKTNTSVGSIAVVGLAVVFGFAIFREQKYLKYLEDTYGLK
jgi:hypothetical protein